MLVYAGGRVMEGALLLAPSMMAQAQRVLVHEGGIEAMRPRVRVANRRGIDFYGKGHRTDAEVARLGCLWVSRRLNADLVQAWEGEWRRVRVPHDRQAAFVSWSSGRRAARKLKAGLRLRVEFHTRHFA